MLIYILIKKLRFKNQNNFTIDLNSKKTNISLTKNIFLYLSQEHLCNLLSTISGQVDSLCLKMVIYQLNFGSFKTKMSQEHLQPLVATLEDSKNKKKPNNLNMNL